MLAELPAEILYNIALHLPTVSCLTNLAQTCQHLHLLIASEDWRIFRAFLKTRFPWVEIPPFFKDASRALASRSRALDKRAVIGRFVVPPRDAIKLGSHQGTRADAPTLGYRPAIDSYEVWNGDLWSDRKEVLAWGAADELIVRVRQTGSHPSDKWVVFNDLDRVSSYDDICGVRLLKSGHYHQESDQEHLIFGRVRGELVHLSISPDDETHEYEQEFVTHGLELERIDLSDGPEPILAAHFENGSVAFYHTTTAEAEVHPFAQLQAGHEGVSRGNKYSKFLSPTRMAVGTGCIEGSLSVSTITPDGVLPYREIAVHSLDIEERVGSQANANVSAVAPLTAQAAGGSSGDVFLTAWGDRAVRLHDLRSGRPYESTYKDTTDDNPIYSVHPFGHDRFMVGAGGDAVVKFFDLRMHNTYSYLNGRFPSFSHHGDISSPQKNLNSDSDKVQNLITYPRKDFSIFLSHPPPSLSNSNRARLRRTPLPYRGPIYTMSSPSALSPTIYAGVVDAVFRLDFTSTDDLASSSYQWYEDSIALDLNADVNNSPSVPERILELSGYERPEADDLTTTSKLRSQLPFSNIGDENARDEMVSGWDRRWERLDQEAPWRRTS